MKYSHGFPEETHLTFLIVKLSNVRAPEIGALPMLST